MRHESITPRAALTKSTALPRAVCSCCRCAAASVCTRPGAHMVSLKLLQCRQLGGGQLRRDVNELIVPCPRPLRD